MGSEEPSRSLALILHSSAYDRLHQAFSIVEAALANDMDVHVYLTYWALEKIVKADLDKIVLDEEHDSARHLFSQGLRNGVIRSLDEMLADSRASGHLHLYACSQSMGLLGITEEQALRRVDKVMGYVAFLVLAEEADLVLTI